MQGILQFRAVKGRVARAASILWILAGLAAVPLAASVMLTPLRIANAAVDVAVVWDGTGCTAESGAVLVC